MPYKDPDKARVYNNQHHKAWRKLHPVKAKRAWARARTKAPYLRFLYGITLDDYQRMLKQQNGGCAICNRPPKVRRLHVDHNHKTGVVRGLLCFRCNYGLSWFSDRPELMNSAAKHLCANTGLRVSLTKDRPRRKKRGVEINK